MKVKRLKNGGFRFSAQSEQDSIGLLKILEAGAGASNDPDRLSLKKQQELDDRKQV